MAPGEEQLKKSARGTHDNDIPLDFSEREELFSLRSIRRARRSVVGCRLLEFAYTHAFPRMVRPILRHPAGAFESLFDGTDKDNLPGRRL